MRALGALLCCLGLAAALAWAPATDADVFGSISLVSAGRLQGTSAVAQASYAESPAISADGRYVAFDGSFAGKAGIFRRDLLTGEIALVAEGDAADPSISEEGRYISFTTTARLDEENDTNAAPDVYVRDMDDPSAAPCGEEWEQRHEACPFELASAVNGSARGLAYTYGKSSFEPIHYGAVASARSALSANGREVAFVTTAQSNLAGEATPMLQVAVRHLDTKQTQLVSVRYVGGQTTDEPVPESEVGGKQTGAVYPGRVSFPYGGLTFFGASLSADGSTVAWMGRNIDQQAPTLPVDQTKLALYSEPLWRRIDEGPLAPTRRVTGGSDPTSPACLASGKTALTEPATLLDPCQGPFNLGANGAGVEGLWNQGTELDGVPQLSANGMTVAFLANAGWVADGSELGSVGQSDDLYVVNMQEGLTRVAAARQLTEVSGTLDQGERTAKIIDLGISPDGTQIALTTARRIFPLDTLALISPPSASSSAATELYEIDLDDETLTRVTQGFEGQAPESGPGQLTASPTFSADDGLLAFSSDEDNLVYGDGNGADDAFLVPKVRFAAVPTPQLISAPPANPLLTPAWDLGVTASSRADGKVLLYVEAPGAGTLSVQAQAIVRVGSARASRRARGRRASRRPAGETTVATRTVATQSIVAAVNGLIEVPLTLARAYAPLDTAQGGLDATVYLTFTAGGHPALPQSIHVTFVRTARASRAKTSRRRGRERRR